jgi:hypothetical protein
MPNSQHFPYTILKNALGELISRPILPVVLSNGNPSVTASGLLDSGADVNVLPYGLGIALGPLWENQPNTMQLSGNLANFETRPVIVFLQFGDLPVIDTAFVWTRAEQVPLIFGQTTCFETYDVCFYRIEASFPVSQRE